MSWRLFYRLKCSGEAEEDNYTVGLSSDMELCIDGILKHYGPELVAGRPDLKLTLSGQPIKRCREGHLVYVAAKPGHSSEFWLTEQNVNPYREPAGVLEPLCFAAGVEVENAVPDELWEHHDTWKSTPLYYRLEPAE